MTGKHKKPSRLMQAVLETVTDMQKAGILTDEEKSPCAILVLSIRATSNSLPGKIDSVQKH